MSTGDTQGGTLDGMTVEQLRDLAKRAEAAAKVQEEKGCVMLGTGPLGSEWRVSARGRVEFEERHNRRWMECHQGVLDFVKTVRKADTANVKFLLASMLDAGLAGRS